MIVNKQDGNNRDSSGQYEYSIYRWVGNHRWLYSYYYKDQTYKVKRELADPEATPASKSDIIQSSRSKASYQPNSKPTTIPSKDRKTKVDNGLKTRSQSEPGTFKVKENQKKIRESQIPQPPPNANSMSLASNEDRRAVTKYEYLYGLKDMSIKYKQYESKGIFVSLPQEIEGNVMQVSLEATEEHPIFDSLSEEASKRKTSVEYYVAYSDNPSIDEWHPILPEQEKEVECELLMFTKVKTAKLRFPALISKRPRVYKDGILMSPKQWTLIDGGMKIQLLVDQEPTSIYTIDYTPNAEFYNPWYLDVTQEGMKRMKQIDRFPDGTNHNKTITLSKYPYVDYEKINLSENYDPNLSEYKPMQVRLVNADIDGPQKATYNKAMPYDGSGSQEVFTKNMTNYKTGEWPSLKPYNINQKSDDAYNGFEYWQDGNKIHFSETFNKSDIYANRQTNHGNAEIEVEYEYLVSSFRLKAILRRNSSNANTLTPIVHEHALKFRVMK